VNYLYFVFAQLNGADVQSLPQNDLTQDTFTIGLRIVFGIAGGVALIVVGFGAFQYVISQGNPQSTNKAKNTIIDGMIGLVIIVLAFAIVSFVVENIR
jgi:hypothetical protein